MTKKKLSAMKWRYLSTSGSGYGETRYWIPDVCHYIDDEETARLIASAPDLLTACLMYRDMITPAQECCDAMDRAIKKATGI